MATLSEPTSRVPLSNETGQSNILLWLVAIGFFMETLDATIVNTALPAMARSLGESPLRMQSVVIAYSLTLAIFIPASGWLADRFGTRRIYFSAILVFTLGSLLCAVSRNLPEIALARVLQGAGGSMLLPVGRLAVLRAYPGDKFLAAISFVTMPALIGPLLGPSLGGWLVEYASWHWIFLINIPIGILGCLATYTSMPEDPPQPTEPFDVVGFLQLGLFMVSVSLALDGLADLRLSHGLVLLLIVFGCAALASYVLRALHREHPLFSLSLFRVRTFTIGVLGNLFARVGSSSMPFLIPLFLQLCLGYSPFQAGLTMLPTAVAGILAKRVVGPVIRHTGYRSFLIGNTVLVGLSMASFALVSVNEPAWLRVIQLFLFGTVNSMQFTAMNTLALKDLPKGETSGGNTLFSMVQMLAMSFAVAAAGALLAAFMERYNVKENPEMALRSFHAAFLCMGAITCTSAWIFWQLSPEVRASKRDVVSLEA
jgi:EmrB/QacA subfamily drug resistance transporter